MGVFHIDPVNRKKYSDEHTISPCTAISMELNSYLSDILGSIRSSLVLRPRHYRPLYHLAYRNDINDCLQCLQYDIHLCLTK